MRVVVTGATGFVGSHAVAALVRRGHEVRALARTPARLPEVLAPLDVVAEAVPGDMTDPDAVAAALEGCDAVLHAAGEMSVASDTGPVGRANVEGVSTVLAEAERAGIGHVVYTSTITAYLPSADPVITPSSELAAPLSEYGASKLEAELLVRERQRAGAPVTSFTIGGVYGPCSPHRNGSFAAVLGALGGLMFVPPGGLGVVDVRDLAEMLARAVELPGAPRHLMAGGRFVTWAQWTEQLADAAGVAIVQHQLSAEEMVALGRKFDAQRSTAGDQPPLSEEAAVIMTSGVPTDDSATVAELGVDFRPTEQTFADLVAYLRSTGEVAP